MPSQRFTIFDPLVTCVRARVFCVWGRVGDRGAAVASSEADQKPEAQPPPRRQFMPGPAESVVQGKEVSSFSTSSLFIPL